MNDQLPARSFAWQENYGAFTIGYRKSKDTVSYINNQKRLHARRTYEQEFKVFLTRHGITPVDDLLEQFQSSLRDLLPRPLDPPLKRRVTFKSASGA